MSKQETQTSAALGLPLDRIVIDPTLQPRTGGLNTDHVGALQENPEAWPPLVVVDRGGYLLVDGFHRYAAAQNLELPAVQVRIEDVPAHADIRALAFALNATHGRPLTLADRRAEAVRLLQADATVSNLEIARRTALSPTTIAAVRAGLEHREEIPAAEQRVSRSGRTYSAPERRQRGDLPEEVESIPERLFTPKERREQRRLVRYFQRLLVALEDQFDLDGWESATAAAVVCTTVLGNDEAANLAQRVGPAARNILDVALALGYRDEE